MKYHCLFLFQTNLSDLFAGSIKSTDPALNQWLEKLKHRLQEEEEFVHCDMDKLSMMKQNIEAGNWRDARSNCEMLLAKLRPFDIHRTVYLINESVKYAEAIKDEHAVVFLGRSGAGKSTTLLYLTGHPMTQRNNAYRDIGPEDGSAPPEFVVNGNPESETAYVRGIPMKLEDLEKMDVDTYNIEDKCTKVVMLDTPGMLHRVF